MFCARADLASILGGGQICKERLFSAPLEVGPLDCG